MERAFRTWLTPGTVKLLEDEAWQAEAMTDLRAQLDQCPGKPRAHRFYALHLENVPSQFLRSHLRNHDLQDASGSP